MTPSWMVPTPEQAVEAHEGRRRFLKGLGVSALAALLLPKDLWAQGTMESFWYQPRRLRVYRVATREYVDAIYWRDGQVDAQGYAQLCQALRDVQAGVVVPISVRLMDLLCAMQAWVVPYGYVEPIHINSGFRTATTNAHLEGAAKQSMHLHGCAADIVLPRLPTSYVGQLAARYQAGGVGFYIEKEFIHVDTGSRRYWVK